MRTIARLLTVLWITLSVAQVAAAESSAAAVLGSWQFHKILYRDGEHPPFNPDLILIFEFHPDGTDRLFWTRRNQHGFCERKGRYSWSAETSLLQDEVIWSNPGNSPECARDPDMLVGRRTETRLEAFGDELRLWLYVGDEPLIYVWRRLLPES